MKPSDIWQFQLMLTEFCTQRCPECAQNIGGLSNPQHMTTALIQEVGPWVQNIEELHLTGGEPMLNPEFDFIVSNIRFWCNPKHLGLTTNARLVRNHAEVLRYIDRMVVTRYTKQFHPDVPENSEEVALLEKHYKLPIRYNEGGHISRKRHGTKPCAKLDAGVVILYPDGLLYRCCNGRGSPGAEGIRMGAHWREEICEATAPCRECFFAEL